MDEFPEASLDATIALLIVDLRAAGMDLGVSEAISAIEALQHGFGLPDHAALRRVLGLLWATSESERDLIADRLAALVSSHSLAVGESAAGQFKSEVPDDGEVAGDKPATLPAQAVGLINSSRHRHNVDRTASSTSEISRVARRRLTVDTGQRLLSEDEVVAALATAAEVLHVPPSAAPGLVSLDYLPVSVRQLKQAWRYLRRVTRTRDSKNMDARATVELFAREGAIARLVPAERKVNSARLVLLVDTGGSMLPFASLYRRVIETVSAGGRLGHIDIAYFHDCPVRVVYEDEARTRPMGSDALFPTGRDGKASLMIVSDAGSARGAYDPSRVQVTRDFLDALTRRGVRVVWINPVPRERWAGTSAAAVGEAVAMFEADKAGFYNGIRVLQSRRGLQPC